jgi:hypothetical protein
VYHILRSLRKDLIMEHKQQRLTRRTIAQRAWKNELRTTMSNITVLTAIHTQQVNTGDYVQARETAKRIDAGWEKVNSLTDKLAESEGE